MNAASRTLKANAPATPAAGTERTPWSVDRWGRLIAGVGVLACTLLGLLHSPYWLYGTLFGGLNLIVTSLTDRCPIHDLLIRLGAREREDLFLPGGTPRGEACIRTNETERR